MHTHMLRAKNTPGQHWACGRAAHYSNNSEKVSMQQKQKKKIKKQKQWQKNVCQTCHMQCCAIFCEFSFGAYSGMRRPLLA